MTRARRKKASKRPSKACSRATFEGLIDGFPSAEGMAVLAWECYRRLSTQDQIKVLEAMNEDGDDESWIVERIEKAQG